MTQTSLVFAGGLCLAALLGASCSSAPYSSAHGNQGVRVFGTVWNDGDTKSTFTPGGATSKPETDVTGIGAAYEQFLGEGFSWTAAIERRNYETQAGADLDANELRFGLRGYLGPQEKLQPFVTVEGFYGDGLDASSAPDSDSYLGIAVGGGLAWWPSKDISLEAGLLYETTLSNPETDLGGGNVREDEISGLTARIGVGFWF